MDLAIEFGIVITNVLLFIVTLALVITTALDGHTLRKIALIRATRRNNRRSGSHRRHRRPTPRITHAAARHQALVRR
jgi:hypothetical protein